MDNKTKKWLDLEKVKVMNKVEQDLLNGKLKIIRKNNTSQILDRFPCSDAIDNSQ